MSEPYMISADSSYNSSEGYFEMDLYWDLGNPFGTSDSYDIESVHDGITDVYSIGFNNRVNILYIKANTTYQYRVRRNGGVWSAPILETTGSFPTNYETERFPTFWPKVTNQWVWGASSWKGEADSCVANAICTMKEVQEYKETGVRVDHSIGWVYGNRLSTDYQGEGMITTQALDRLKADGTPKYNDLLSPNPLTPYYPDVYYYYDWYDSGSHIIGAKTLVQENYNTGVLTQARARKISSYSRLNISSTPILGVKQSTFEQIKAAIINNGCVLIETNIANNFYNVGTDGVVPNVDSFTNIGHVMVILGWRVISGRTHWIVHNDWNDWGSNGICYIPIQYIGITSYYIVVDATTPDVQSNPPKYIDFNDITMTSVVVEWEVDATALESEIYVYDAATNAFMNSFSHIPTDGPGIFTKLISGFTPGKEYYVMIRTSMYVGSGISDWLISFTFRTPLTARPTNFTGFSWITSGGTVYDTVKNADGTYTAYIMTASEWNSFTAKINEFRRYKALSNYSFTTVSRDTLFSSAIINQAVVAINEMGFYIPAASGNISANFLVNMLKGYLNSIP